MLTVLKVGGVYFAVVFAAGFALGAIRMTWLAPRVGERMAELLETPLMIVVSFLAARWLVRRSRAVNTHVAWLGVGLVALALMLLVEFTVVLWLRGMTLTDYFANRDPLSTAVYFTSLGIFALLPAFLSWLQRGKRAAASVR